MIEIDRLVKRFGPIAAVDGISLTVAPGEVLGFLGPNGAGKSTTMKMVTGFLSPTSGTIKVCGHDVATAPILAKSKIGYLPEGAPAYGDMTPEGFLNFIAKVRGLSGSAAQDAVALAVARTDIAAVLDQPIDTLSKGFKRRVGLAQAILHDPAVLIMDEPTDGLDPNQKFQVRRLIQAMAKDKTIVISTHILEEVEAICTRAVIIDRGRLLADGTPDELAARDPRHHAVVVELEADSMARAAQALQALGRVEVEVGLPRLRVFGGVDIASVADALKAASLAPRGLALERGRLDDVFRALTRPETGTGAPRQAA